MIYLDNCSTTKPDSRVISVMTKILENSFGNPSSLHSLGFQAEKIVNECRDNISKLINCNSKEIYFTSGGTESNNIAIESLINKNRRYGNHIITTLIEHPSVKNTISHFESLGYEVTYLSVNSKGLISVDELINSISDKTILVSLFHVNNEIGTINDINTIVKKVKDKNKNTFVHVDGVQAFGKIKFNIKSLGCDSYAFSGHKIHGPKGIGGLYIKGDIYLKPVVYGGGQEGGFRPGTENVPAIGGLNEAIKLCINNIEKDYNGVKNIKEYMLLKVKESLDGYIVNSSEESSPYVLNISIEGIRGEVLLHYLGEKNIYISTASACSSKDGNKKKVVKYLGLSDELVEGTVRICFSRYTTQLEIDEFVNYFIEYIKEIRNIVKR